MKIIFFYNSKSGTIKEDPELIENIISEIKLKQSSDVSLEIYDVIENDVKNIIKGKTLSGEDRILIAGGDGTISSVINQVIDFKIPVGILPLGTFNNFSKSIGMSQEIEKSIDQFLTGEIENIDVGKVNGKIMINNSSVGIYPKLVSIREDQQVRFGLGKPTAMLISFLKAILLFPLIRVSIKSNGKKVSAKTCFAMVSNNRYELSLFEIGERKSLNEGLLYVYFAKCQTRLCVIRVLLKALFNRLKQEKDFELIATKKVEFNIKKRDIEVASDGEVLKLTTPLRYQICSGCLKIVMPKNNEKI